jgi:predicted DNA-binding helix-hairpin-helix protein
MANVIRRPTTEEKLDILAASARHDVCLATCSGNTAGGVGRLRDPVHPESRWIYPAHVPGRGEVGILKILQTNACKNHCSYCFLSSRCDRERRVSFDPQELADLFMGFVRARLAHGIFLSSGVGQDPDLSMARMVQTAEILRRRHGFGGYIHLKVLPGCSAAAVEQAALVADRISVNLEAPSARYLQALAPEKRFARDLLGPMRVAAGLVRQRMGGRRSAPEGSRGLRVNSHTTQFVVGAGEESDLDILRTVDWLYRELYVFRAYFSAFQPPPGGGRVPLGPAIPGDHSLAREHRLYQCDFLLRGYGFRLPDLVFDRQGRLPANVDPKMAHALMHPELYPVDVNHAPEELLLRVPGIGPVAARRIAERRRRSPFRGLGDLKATGAALRRAEGYLEFSGRRDGSAASRGGKATQGWLFEEMSVEGWHTGVLPSDLSSQGGSEQPPELRRPYPYPGQSGKPLYYRSRRGSRVRPLGSNRCR